MVTGSDTNSSAAIRVVDAGKRYVKFDDVPTLIGLAKRLKNRKRRGDFWAVRNLSFEVAQGETIGIIGRNGAGKTTTLRMLAGVTAPTEGLIAVSGRVSPLIAVGVGFHQELTGRENVYVNGTVLGMTRRQIDELFDSIVDFAEIADFIDTPVKFYSSGMLVRLGFSVAVAARPGVLLVDEILAVGDLPFQIKCYARMAEIQASGTSTVVVSHNLAAVRNLCSRVVVMDSGSPRFIGPTSDGLAAYHQLLDSRQADDGSRTHAAISITQTELLNTEGRPTYHVQAGEEVVARVHAKVTRPVAEPMLGFAISADTGMLIYQDATFRGELGSLSEGERITFDMRFTMDLGHGTYSVQGIARWGLDANDEGAGPTASFYVVGRPWVRGTSDLKGTFELSSNPEVVGTAGVDIGEHER